MKQTVFYGLGIKWHILEKNYYLSRIFTDTLNILSNSLSVSVGCDIDPS